MRYREGPIRYREASVGDRETADADELAGRLTTADEQKALQASPFGDEVIGTGSDRTYCVRYRGTKPSGVGQGSP